MRNFINIIAEANHWGNGPAADFLDRFNEWEKKFNLDDKGFIVDIENRQPDEVHIDMLWVPEDQRSLGWGKRIIEGLKTLADQTGTTLTLVPAWQDDEVEPHFSLSQWYQSLGFEPRADVLVYFPEKTY